MKTLKTVLLSVGIAIFPLALAAADLMKPNVYFAIGDTLRGLTDYQINKLDRASPLTDKQKYELRAMLTEEAAKLEALQKKSRGDLTVILREGLPVICETSANILKTLTPAQRTAAGNDLVIERREGFQNTLRLSLTELWTRFEKAANLPELMGTAAAPAP